MVDDYLMNIVNEGEKVEENQLKEPPTKPEPLAPPAEPLAPADSSVNIPVDKQDYFTEHFEGYENVEIVKENLKNFKEQQTELTDLRTQKEQFANTTKELNDLKVKSPYEDPNYFKLEQISKESPDDVSTYQKHIFGGLSAIDYVKLQFVQQNPDYKDQPEKVSRWVERKYPSLFDSEIESDSQEYMDAKMDLEVEVGKIKRTFDDRLKGIEVPDPVKGQADVEKQKTEFIEKWKPGFSKIKDDFGKIDISVNSENGKDVEQFMEIEIPKEKKEAYYKFAAEYIVNNNLPDTEESIRDVKSLMNKMYIVDNLNEYNTMIAEQVSKAEDGKWRKAIHNPKPTKEGVQPKVDSSISDNSQEIFEALMSEVK